MRSQMYTHTDLLNIWHGFPSSAPPRFTSGLRFELLLLLFPSPGCPRKLRPHSNNNNNKTKGGRGSGAAAPVPHGKQGFSVNIKPTSFILFFVFLNFRFGLQRDGENWGILRALPSRSQLVDISLSRSVKPPGGVAAVEQSRAKLVQKNKQKSAGCKAKTQVEKDNFMLWPTHRLTVYS